MNTGGERGEYPFTYYTEKISLSSFRKKRTVYAFFLNIRDSIHSIHSIIRSIPRFPEPRDKYEIDGTIF